MRIAFSAMACSLLLIAPISACSASWSNDDKPGVPAQGSGGERHYAVSGFDKVALAASGDAEVRTGRAFGLSVTGDPAVLDTLKVTRDGETLSLGFKRGMHWTGNGRVHWVVTMPRLAAASIGGSGSIRVDHVQGGRFEGNIGGSGDLSVAAMQVDQAAFNVGGSGTITAAGQARAIDVSIGGSGDVRAAGLSSGVATISVAGAGSVRMAVHGRAKVSLVGAGDVTLTGGAQCSVSKMGVGNVRCS